MLKSLVTGLIIGLVAVVFSISFAAIIYTGDMAGYLSRGIGFTLLGATVMAFAGAFTLSYRGTIVQPQDVTAVILSFAVATIAAGWTAGGDELFATVAVLVAVSTLATGLACFAVGWFRLGFIVRFIPYPVLGGFLAATGYLLLTGAVGMTIGQSVTLSTAGLLVEPDNAAKWIPWVAAGAVFYAIARRVRHGLVLPLCIIASVLLFHAVLWLWGTDLATAQESGLLLGPFDAANFYETIDPSVLVRADWWAIARHLPTLLAVIGTTIIGSLLNASAMELAIGARVDPDRELRGVGITNITASLVGGLTGYHLLSQTLFAGALGVTSRLAGLAVAAVTLLALLFGARILSLLPIGVFAAVIAFLGIDLLVGWLWVERRRLPVRDYLIVLLILATAATAGFLPAIAVGTLAAAILFILAYAGIGIVRLKTTAATKRSHVERGSRDLAILEERGERAAIYELSGYLFFGSAGRILEEVAAACGAARDFIVIDFRRVQGIDASAAFTLRKIADEAGDRGTHVVLTGLSPALRHVLVRSGVGSEGQASATLLDHLNDGLQMVEDQLIQAGRTDRADDDFLNALQQARPAIDLEAHLERIEVKAGTVVFEQDGPADSLAFLLSGTLKVEQIAAPSHQTPVALILPGALIGEVGLYAGTKRTARVTAAEDCVLLRLDAKTLAGLETAYPGIAAAIHRHAATHLARRLARTMSLLQDADV
jgi:SulP family sulfate permease